MGGYSSSVNWNAGYAPGTPATGSPTPTTPSGVMDWPEYPAPGGGKFGYMNVASIGEEQQQLALAAQGYAGTLSTLTGPELSGYTQYLNEMTSKDPTQRMAAAGPAASAEQTTQEAARKSIRASTPRGGGQDAAVAASYTTEASDIGNFISNAYTQAQQAKGNLGEWGAGETLSALGTAESGYAGAASTTATAVDEKWRVQQYHDQMVMQLLEAAAGGYGASGSVGATEVAAAGASV